VVALKKAGHKGPEIAVQVGIPVFSVYSILRRYEVAGTVETPKRPGRPPSLTERDIRRVVRTSKQNRRKTLQDITNLACPNVSPDTVRKALVANGINSRVAAKKPYLSAQHRLKRLQFAKRYRYWTNEDWKKVIWTDESSVEIGHNSRQIRVWRTSDEKHNEECFTPTFKSGRTSVMVLGAISHDCK